jgi:hypothetical protein
MSDSGITVQKHVDAGPGNCGGRLSCIGEGFGLARKVRVWERKLRRWFHLLRLQ